MKTYKIAITDRILQKTFYQYLTALTKAGALKTAMQIAQIKQQTNQKTQRYIFTVQQI